MKPERDLPLTVFKPHVQTYAIVYCNTGEYDLLGHGFLSIKAEQIEDQTAHYLEVESVQDSEVLLKSRLQLSHNYEKQRGSVIAWTDNLQKGHHDLAISFEEDRQCDAMWRLICEKIGKNYLEIKGTETLNIPTDTNLPYILEKTKTSKDMIEYNLLNNPKFSTALTSVFQGFMSKKDKMGMGMMGRIIKSIFSSIDYVMVQTLFTDPMFQLILDVQKCMTHPKIVLTDVDYPKMWIESLKIRSIVPLSEELTTKIHLIHRLNFYRQNILDLKADTYLENILVMTKQEFSKDIILYLIKEDSLEELIKLTYQSAQEQHLLALKDIAEEDTFQSENEEIKRLQLGEKKIEFVLEAIIISKQMESQAAKVKFFDKIFKCGIMEMAADYMDKGLDKSLDFFNCFSQLAPLRFVQYLKTKYRESPADNLHTKLSKKYCLGSEQAQLSILEIIKNLADTFKIKENLDFFMGTFFASVFGCCKESKPILNALSEMQNVIQNVETFFTQAIKSKVFQTLVIFLRNFKQDKRSELNAIKILKRILIENADSSWSFRKQFLTKLNEEVIKSGFFDYCMTVLQKYIMFNNIISSSMLENIKIIREIKRFTVYHKDIQANYKQSESLAKYLKTIMEAKEEKEKEDEDEDNIFNQARIQDIEQAREEAYLLSQMQEEPNFGDQGTDPQKHLDSLRLMRTQIEQQKQRDDQLQRYQNPGKKVKPNEQIVEPLMSLQFDLPFDEDFQEGK